MTKEIDDGLTDEERAAINSSDDEADSENTETEAAAEDLGAKEGDDGEQEPAAEAKADDKPAGDDKPAEQPEATDETQPQPAPVLVAPASEEIQGKLTDVQAKKDALLAAFDEGDKTAKEYQQELDALNKEERALERQMDRAELAESLNKQSLQNDWNRTCEEFISENAIYKTNSRLYKALDAEVKDLANKPETATWSGRKFLEEAHKNLKEAFGIADAAKPATRKAPATDLPPNLAKIPAAEIEDTSGNKYAALDRLMDKDPEAYEEALLKLPKAEREAYMASA